MHFGVLRSKMNGPILIAGAALAVVSDGKILDYMIKAGLCEKTELVLISYLYFSENM